MEVPVSCLEAISEKYGATEVILIARFPEHLGSENINVVTYGKSPEQSDFAAMAGSQLASILLAQPQTRAEALAIADRVRKDWIPSRAEKPMMLYIAGPYSGDVDANIAAAEKVAIAVFQAGHYALCPHVATAHFDRKTGIQDIDFWYRATLDMLSRCDGIVMMPGWERSKGASMERAWAIQGGMSIWEYPDLPGSEEAYNEEMYMDDAV